MARIVSDRLKTEISQRWLEIVGIIVVTVLLGGISRLETRLYELSTQLAKDDTFIASIFFYGIINLNVFLAIILSFLVIRNIAKLVVERRRGVFGSRLRTKLVTTLMVFALTPTVIVFYVSTRFINQSFDEWFGGRVREVIQQARDIGGQIYLQDQRRLEGIARVAASKLTVRPSIPFLDKRPPIEGNLDGFEIEYGVNSVQVFDREGKLKFASVNTANRATTDLNREHLLVGSVLGRFATRTGLMSLSIVDADEKQDIVRAAVPLRVPKTSELAGVVVVEERFDMPFLRSIEKILDSFGSLKPGAQLLRVSYLILVTVMTLMIIFGAVWFGFRVARTIIGPIQILADATREVALGNYTLTLSPLADDETGQLMKSFNTMTIDLERHRKSARDSQIRLQLSNEELERRRRYMEVVFANIAAGVIAVDAKGQVTAFNHAAATMLKTDEVVRHGSDIKSYLGEILYKLFWLPVVSNKNDSSASSREIDLRPAGIDLVLFIASTDIRGEDGEDLGVVVVFDDATQRVKQQRVMAWREVASRIAHEIKNPITPIKLSAERLLRRFGSKFDGDDKDVFQRCVESILTQVESLRTLVNEFGKFARLPTIRPTLSELIPVIRHAMDVFKEGYPAIDFKFVIESSTIPQVMIDPEQMNRALVNVIGNAVDAMMESSGRGELVATCTWDKAIEKVVILITDTGPGIPADIKDRVFEPYVSSKSGGTGLGLAIASQIIAEHGGYVRIAKSSAEGTTIRIELPPADRYDSSAGGGIV